MAGIVTLGCGMLAGGAGGLLVGLAARSLKTTVEQACQDYGALPPGTAQSTIDRAWEAYEQTFTSCRARLIWGIAAAGAGDTNADGHSDVIVGATRYSDFTGRAYVYHGGAGMDCTADVTMIGEAVGNGFGCRVAGTAGPAALGQPVDRVPQEPQDGPWPDRTRRGKA